MNKLIKSVVFLAACSLVFAGCEKKNKKGSNDSSDQQSSQPSGSGDGGSGSGGSGDGGSSGGGQQGGGGDSGSQLLDDEITLTVADKVYDGQAIAVTATATSGRTATVSYTVQNNASEAFFTAPKDAGVYTVHASLDANETYKAATKDANFTISQKEVGLIWVSPANLTYDEQPKVPTVSASQVLEGDVVNVQASLKEGEDNINVGTFHFEATALDNPNYKLPENKVSDAFEITKANRPAQIIHLGEIPYKPNYDLSCNEFALPEGYSWATETAPGLIELNDLGKYSFKVLREGDANHYDLHTTADFTIVRGDPTTREGYAPIELAARYGEPLCTALMGYTPEYIEGWAFEDDPTQPINKISVGDNHPTYKMSYNCGDPHYFVKEHIDITVVVGKGEDNITDFSAEDKVYDGNAFVPMIPTMEEITDVSYEYYEQSDTEHSAPLAGAPKDVGDYTVVAVSQASDHYDVSAAGADFSITQAVGEISFKSSMATEYATVEDWKAVTESSMYDYNGEHSKVKFRYNSSFNFLSWNSLKPTTAGTWYVKVMGDDDNFTACEAVTQVVVGSAKPGYDLTKFAWTNIGSFNKDYDGAACPTPSLTYNSVGLAPADVTIHWQLEGESTWNLFSDDVVNAGKYKFRFIIAENEDFHTVTLYYDVEINKIDPRSNTTLSSYETPDYFGVHYGEHLSDLVADEGYLPKPGGKWYFKDDLDTSVGPVGTSTFQMRYEPDDKVNFLTIDPIDITFAVGKATAQQAIPKNLSYPINTSVRNIPLPPEFTWTYSYSTVSNVALGWTSLPAKCNPSDNVDCAPNTNVSIPILATAGKRSASMQSRWQNGVWNAPIKVEYDGDPITYIVEPNAGHSQNALTNYDLALTYGPYETAPYTVEFKLQSENDVNYSTLIPSEPGEYNVRLSVEEYGKYLGIVFVGEFSIVYPDPVYRYVDTVENKTYQFWIDSTTSSQTTGHVDVFPFIDKSVEELRDYNPDEVLRMEEHKEYDDFLETKLLTCIDTTEYAVQVQFTADLENGQYVLTKLGPMVVQYAEVYEWVDDSDPGNPVEMVQEILYFTMDGPIFDHLCGDGYYGPKEDYDPSAKEVDSLNTMFIWYEYEGYVFVHRPYDSWLYIYEITGDNLVTYVEPLALWNGEYVYQTGYGIGILFELGDDLYISFTESGWDPSNIENYSYYSSIPCDLTDVEDEDTHEVTTVLSYYVEYDGYYDWVIADHEMYARYEVDFVDYTVVNTNGYVFYQATYPTHIETKMYDGDNYVYYLMTTYDEETQTWYCSYEDYAGNLQTLIYQVSPDNPAEVYQLFGNIVISGQYTYIDMINPDDENTWVYEHYYLYAYDSGIVIWYEGNTPAEHPATDPYYWYDFGEYDEETHTLTMTDGYQYTYENGVFTEVSMI